MCSLKKVLGSRLVWAGLENVPETKRMAATSALTCKLLSSQGQFRVTVYQILRATQPRVIRIHIATLPQIISVLKFVNRNGSTYGRQHPGHIPAVLSCD